ncbi:Per1-like protein [Pleurotus eryngii]|uniref:Post-GPI attachment to proteins factor 3 n=1 Tax=Pleurotus eryngii TaxID=5323 RepID=A0A9P6DF56_PLEER|nr:Per1-like protein [Pleurotus eryngii]
MFVSVPIVLALISGAVASSGDRSQQFTRCVSKCELEICQIQRPHLPLALRLTGWTCLDNCKYDCMHSVTENDVASGRAVQQYYGKWPFWRLAGIQEPASVLFSLLNLWAHAHGLSMVRKYVSADHPMKIYYTIWAMVSINAWLWSSVFHTRDLPTTEKLDYFGAALAILFALYFTVIRHFQLYSSTRSGLTSRPFGGLKRTSTAHKAWSLFCCTLYVGHVLYLSLLPRFDYSYNMFFNLFIGFTHNILWALYSLPASMSLLKRFPNEPKSYRPPFASSAALFVLLTTAATALELFDFPPWGGYIDAHSLWHLSTAPISLFWYRFLVKDATEPGWRFSRS